MSSTDQTDLNKLTVTLTQAELFIKTAMRAKTVPFLRSSPGLGKSELMKRIAQTFGLKLVDIRLAQYEPPDLNGYPTMYQPESTGKDAAKTNPIQRSRYAPFEELPLRGQDELPEGFNGWLLLLDELPQADYAVQKAAYRLILDRQVGNHDLHPNVAMVLLGNLDTDNTHVNEIGTALQSRIAPHLELQVDTDAWLAWAYSAGIDPRVTSFIECLPDLLHDFDPDHIDHTYPCPRTYVFLSQYLRAMEQIAATDGVQEMDAHLPAIAGIIGKGTAYEFLSFVSSMQSLPKFTDLMAAPAHTALPDSPNLLYALTGTLAFKTNTSNLATVLQVVDRLPPEFQVISLRAMKARKPEICAEDALIQWQAANIDKFSV